MQLLGHCVGLVYWRMKDFVGKISMFTMCLSLWTFVFSHMQHTSGHCPREALSHPLEILSLDKTSGGARVKHEGQIIETSSTRPLAVKSLDNNQLFSHMDATGHYTAVILGNWQENTFTLTAPLGKV